MHSQVIYSRYEYPLDKSSSEVFQEYSQMFDNRYDEQGIIIWGASIAVASPGKPNASVIVLTYCEEADAFLTLKFAGRKDVRYCRIKKGKENG